jgi:hypothetical protein
MRSLLYTIAKFLGDYNAVKRGRVGRRIARRVYGKATGRAWRGGCSAEPAVYLCLTYRASLITFINRDT